MAAVDVAVVADTEKGRCVLPFAVHAENRRWPLEARQMIGARRMSQMMLDGHEGRSLPVHAERFRQRSRATGETTVTAIAVQQRVPVPGPARTSTGVRSASGPDG